MVHSDPEITPLEVSWPVREDLKKKLAYTGYVAPAAPDPHPEGLGSGEIIVSAGGGSVGTPLYQAAMDAGRDRPDRTVRLLIGGRDAAARIASLSADGVPDNVSLEPARPDFRQMLCHADASISMCGYNTAMDLMQTGIPAVLVPFDEGKEVEQGLRAQSMERLSGVATVTSDRLSGPALNRALDDVLREGRRDVSGIAFDGATETVRIATEMAEARR